MKRSMRAPASRYLLALLLVFSAWPPAERQLIGATSYLYHPAGLRVRQVDAKEFDRLDLLSACR